MIIFFSIPLEAKDIPDKLGIVWKREPTFAQRSPEYNCRVQINLM